MNEPDKVEWREYALLQALQDKPVIPWKDWCTLSGAAKFILAVHPDLTAEDAEEWADIT